MIWDVERMGAGARDAQQVENVTENLVRGILAQLGGQAALSDAQTEALSRTIADYAREQTRHDADESKYFVMLLGQALDAIGELDAARRVLVLGSGLIKPSVWEVSGEDAVWVIDLRQFSVARDAPLEMVLFRCLSAVLESIAEVWDASDGTGTLGLRHVFETASEMLRRRERSNEVRRLADEIRERCDMRLRDIGRRRGWNSAPHVLHLEV